MREFFRGWRRKIGVVTLVLACVFMAGWVRSYVTEDMLSLPVKDPSLSWLTSTEGIIVWMTISEPNRNPEAAEVSVEQNTEDDILVATAVVNSFGGYITSAMTITSFWFIPYWSLVLPLTLLSAWLLLSKPHSSNPKKTIDPKPDQLA